MTIQAPIARPLEIAILPGQTIQAVLDDAQVPAELHPYVMVQVNGRLVNDWAHVYTRDGDQVAIYALPAGGDNKNGVIGAIALIAVSVLAVYTGGLAAGAYATWAGVSTTSAAAVAVGSAVSASITLVGSLLVTALIPPPSAPGLSGSGSAQSRPAQESPSYSFSGQSNQARIHQRVPRLYGRHRMSPPLAATPQIMNQGKTSRVAVLYDFGIGDIRLSDLRIGDLPLDTVDPEIRIYHRTTDPGLDLMGRSTAYDQLDYALDRNDPLLIYTKPDSVACVVDLNFPSGLVRFNRNGERRMHSAGVRIRYRRQGSGDPWELVPAEWYKGARKEKEDLLERARYDVPDLIDMQDIQDAWVVHVDDRGEGYIHLFRNGKEIYSERHPWAYDRIISRDLGGRTYRRGVSRDQVTAAGAGTWIAYELIETYPAPDNTVLLTARTAVPFVVSARIQFDEPAVWEVEITRTTQVADQTQINSLRDAMRVGVIRSRRRGDLLKLRKPHTLVEIEYEATDKISGVIQNLNAVGTSRLRMFDGAGFIAGTFRATANPAHIGIDILTGDAAKRPRRANQIDWPSWNRLRQRCNEQVTQTVNGIVYTAPRYEWNGIIDTDLTVREALEAVLSVARASVMITQEGKIGVILDEAQNTPRQLFTPANSWGFQGSRPFVAMPDEMRVSFIDRDADWVAAECIVRRPGSTAAVPVVEDLTTFGITSYPEAWRYGRYMMAQGIVRSERLTLSVDVENLAVQRGDLVLVQHDVPMFGGQAFRVIARTGPRITLDQPVHAPRGRYTVRRLDGTIASGSVVAQLDEDRIEVSRGPDFEVDALVVLDIGSEPALPYLVASIAPGSDLSARLDLVPYNEDVWAGDRGPLPEWNPGIGTDLLDRGRPRIKWGAGGLRTGWGFVDGVPTLALAIEWEVQSGIETYAGGVIEVKLGNESWTPVFTTTGGAVRYEQIIPWDAAEWFMGDVSVRVTPYSALGRQGPSIKRTISLPPYEQVPDAPQNLALDVRSQEVALAWEASPSPDVVRYAIRYSPDVTSAATWDSAQHLGRVTFNTTAFATGARTGTYFVAAENRAGRYSPPALARTTIESLPDLNVIETRNDAPAWPGRLSNFTRGRADAWSYTEVLRPDGTLIDVAAPPEWNDTVDLLDGGSILLLTDVDVPATTLVSTGEWSQLGPDDYAVYQFASFLPLGAVFECRIQSLLRARAVSTFRYEGPALQQSRAASATGFDAEQDEDWAVWLEYRAIDEISVMADWVPNIAAIPNMAFGTAEFGPWRPVRVGDATGRIFQFRIVAKAYRDGMLILIEDGAIEVDMPDRVWRYENFPVNTTTGDGEHVTFDPAFAAPPVLAITTQGAVAYRVQNLTRGSFDLLLLDANATPTTGSADIAALGYGRERATSI